MLKYGPMERPAIGVFALLTLATAAFCQISEADAPAMMAQLAKKNQAWNQKLNGPGLSLSLVEVARDSHRIRYELHTAGFPPNRKYTIVQWPANRLQPQDGMKGVTLDATGRAICAGTPGMCSGRSPNSPIQLQFSPFKTEPIRIALVSDDDQHLRAVVNFVPISNRVTDKGCSLESVMLAPNSSLVALQGSGFKPAAKLTLLSESEGERHDGPLNADADGNLYFAMGQGVKGKEQGTTKLTVSSSECSLSLTLRWGKDSYEY